MSVLSLLRAVCAYARPASLFAESFNSSGAARCSVVALTGSKEADVCRRALGIFALGLVTAAVQAQTISTAAGNGTSGFSGDNGSAVDASINYARGIEADAAGNLYIVDTNNSRIRKVTAGVISTVAGNGGVGSYGDGGLAIDAGLSSPNSVAVAADGGFYIADTGNQLIRKVAADGVISTIAGTGVGGYSGDGGDAHAAMLNGPNGLAFGADGTLYIADSANHRIRKVAADGVISTVAGNGVAGFGGDGGAATQANLNKPYGVAVDADGNLYIADTYNHRVRKVALDGTISTVAGTGVGGYSGDGGSAISAKLSFPIDVAVDGNGIFYIADTYNHRVRKVLPDGTIDSVAGNNVPAYNGDGGNAAEATLNYPRSVSVDGDGNLYIADTDNQRIRRIDRWMPAAVLTASPTPSTYGETVSLVATVTGDLTGPVVSGAVTFTGGSGTFCDFVVLADEMASCSVGDLGAGTHTLSAVYSGDSVYAPSLFHASHTVAQASSSASIGTISPNPSKPGQKVTVTASVASSVPSAPTGTVAVSDTVGQCTITLSRVGDGLSSGSCVLARAILRQGDYQVTARYSGDANFAPSDAPVVLRTVKIGQ